MAPSRYVRQQSIRIDEACGYGQPLSPPGRRRGLIRRAVSVGKWVVAATAFVVTIVAIAAAGLAALVVCVTAIVAPLEALVAFAALLGCIAIAGAAGLVLVLMIGGRE